jgi:hypothetical protein
VGVSPEEVVDPPATELAMHGLVRVARNIGRLREEGDGRWEGGFVFQPENCIASEVWVPCGGNDQVVFTIAVDATGGSWAISYEGGPETLVAFDATPAEVEAALLATLPGLVPDGVYVRGGPGSADGDAGISPYYVVFDMPAGYNVMGGLIADSTADPLTGGTGVVVNPIQIPGFITPAPDVKKDYDGEQGPIRVHPYTVEVPYTCSSWGFSVNDYEGKAARQLQAGLSKAIEEEFWTGANAPSNPNLTYWTPNDDQHIVNPGGAAAPVAVNVSIGIALLEQALASCGHGGRGMIHASPIITSRSAGLYLIDDDDTNEGRILTTRSRGDIIIAGAGYQLNGPFGQPDPGTNQGWMFATGMVDVWLGAPRIYPEEFAHALDRATNTVTFRGEQTAVATHDACCTFAVLVDYSADL